MTLKRTLAVVGISSITLAAASMAVLAAPTTSPTTQSMRPHAVRLSAPWNKVPDLTDDQKGKINTIHEDTADKIKAMEAAEKEQCLAILTAAQRTALQEALDKQAAEKKKPKKK